MIIVVDTNIVFSGILSPKATISDILLNSQNSFDFYAPSIILEELEAHHRKLLKLSGYKPDELEFLKRTIMKKINLIDVTFISPDIWVKAIELTKEIDEFDAPFVALSLELKSPLWTGDKKLTKGLHRKGIDWIINTPVIQQIRNEK